MPPTVDPTSGIPIMGQDQSNQVVNSSPSPQNLSQGQPVQYQQTPQQLHQKNLINSVNSYSSLHSTEPQMMNTVHGTQMVYPHMQKSKIAVLLFGILLGALGVHNFYLGFTSRGVAQLLISVLTLGILAFIPAIWALVEVIVIFTDDNAIDANGIPLKN